MRWTIVMLGMMLCCAPCPVAGQELPLQPFSYHEGWEGEAPQVTLWANNGPSTVNFLGPSDEQAFEGKRSLKLDVNLDGGTYHYWGAAVRAPCAGTVRLSARVLVAQGTTARVGFGTNMVYPPTHHSGCGPAETFDGPTGEWRLVEVDLVERAAGADRVLRQHTGNVTGGDVGVYLDRWALFIYGGEGKRAVVYLDDVRIEGEAPAEADYDREIGSRWQKAQERFAEQIAGWRRDLQAGEAAVARAEAAPGPLAAKLAAAKEQADAAHQAIDRLEEAGYGSPTELQTIESALYALRFTPQTVEAIAAARAAGKPFLLYGPRAMTNDRLLPDTFPIPAPLAEELSCSGCRGEYESVSVAAYAIDDIQGLEVSAEDLTGPAGAIPADAVDIRVVKVWYQAGRGIRDLKGRILVPELLLKDDDLVRVDTEAQQNALRSTAPDGIETYLLCSGPTSENLENVRPVDADELQPVGIPADTLKQFWITIHIPEDCEGGRYEGKVQLRSAGASAELPLTVTVHPFDLQPSRLIYSIYYRAKLSPDDRPTITSELRSEEQYRAETADFRAHGVLFPTNYQNWDDRLIRRVLEIREEVGMPDGPFFNLGRSTGNTADPAQLAALQEDAEKWIDLCGDFGYDPVYFYGIDEATGERLASQKMTWQAVQDAGGKTFVACYKKTFEAMGPLLNCAVLAGHPDPTEGEKWHSVGSLAFCYANPQVGPEEPETFRRNFGLLLWKAGFDGAMDYAYQHGFGHVWNDFDSASYRDHNFTYPTVNGVIDTVQWEGFREGVDDVRYVTTLERAIEAAPAAKAGVAAEAKAWVEGLDPAGDLDELRARMVEWIEKLN
jgi:hypothetical protein